MKGFHVLYEACNRLWQRRQDFELLATGDAPEEPEPFVRYIGWLSQQELARQLRDADGIEPNLNRLFQTRQGESSV